MSFEAAVKATRAIADHFAPGLQALRKDHRERIRISKPRCLDGSVDLDNALQTARPREPRWDYGVGLKTRLKACTGTVQVVWIEPHPASSSHIDVMLNKLDWLLAWLREEAPALDRLNAEYVWFATGAVALPANSPQRKRIAAQGLLFRAQWLDLDDFRD
jgi:hypothetical protein